MHIADCKCEISQGKPKNDGKVLYNTSFIIVNLLLYHQTYQSCLSLTRFSSQLIHPDVQYFSKISGLLTFMSQLLFNFQSQGKGNFLETGKNTLQKTLLLKREVEIDKVQYELDQKRKEFEKRMEECHYMKEDLKLKQKIVSFFVTL